MQSLNLNNIESISYYLPIKNIILLASTNKNYYKNKRNLIVFSILNKYKQIDYSTLESSSYNINLLEIKNIKHKLYLDLTQNDITDEKIIATYKIFKLSEEINITNHNDIYTNNITNQLIEYFDEIYRIKYNTHSDNYIKNLFKLILNYNNELWYKCDINLYNIYEIFRNLKSKKKRIFKENIKKSFIIDNKITNEKETLLFIMLCSHNITNKKIKYYIIYVIFTIVNHNLISSSSIIDKKFMKTILTKIEQLEYELNNDYKNILPNYFKILLLNIFENIKNIP